MRLHLTVPFDQIGVVGRHAEETRTGILHSLGPPQGPKFGVRLN